MRGKGGTRGDSVPLSLSGYALSMFLISRCPHFRAHLGEGKRHVPFPSPKCALQVGTCPNGHILVAGKHSTGCRNKTSHLNNSDFLIRLLYKYSYWSIIYCVCVKSCVLCYYCIVCDMSNFLLNEYEWMNECYTGYLPLYVLLWYL